MPTLQIPSNGNSPVSAISPSCNGSAATQTGRPSLWRNSSQRKLGRLYVYTTLKVDEILAVVKHSSSSETGPG
jgi:hypothetical protein